jgi:hypothetical protein
MPSQNNSMGVIAVLLAACCLVPGVLARGERPSNVIKLGAILPITKDGKLYTDEYGDSVSKLTAFMLAIRDVNIKYGKLYNVSVHYTVLDSQGHYGIAGGAVSTLATNGFPASPLNSYGRCVCEWMHHPGSQTPCAVYF